MFVKYVQKIHLYLTRIEGYKGDFFVHFYMLCLKDLFLGTKNKGALCTIPSPPTP